MSSKAPTEQKRRAPPPPLPEPCTLTLADKCELKYLDIQPPSHTPLKPTIVLIHGSPGTYNDFKYLIPLLQHDARVVGINLPGFGGSTVLDKSRYYEHISALGEAAIAYEALAQICGGEQSVFIVGHSFGGHTTLNLAAMNVEQTKLQLRGIALLASAGYRPHKAMWPVTSTVLSKVISTEIPLVSTLASSLVRAIYINVIGFPGNEPTSHYVSGLVRCDSTSFDVVNDHVKRVADVPAFIAYAKDDTHIEEEIFTHMSVACHAGPRLVFDNGGHNIQKTKAEVIATELTRWISELLTGADSSSNSKTE